MHIQGYQKLTLLDFPDKIACTVFTGGCNLRCPFCHNGSLVRPGEATKGGVDPDEFLAFLRKRQGTLDGVCVSGGEPLLQPDIDTLLREIRALGFAVKLDTNGSFPDRLRSLVEQGLVDYVAMDIKNSRARYGETVGIPGYDTAPIEESVAYLLSDAVPYEFRTTVVREFHTLDDFAAIGAWLRGARRYYLQHFVDSGDLLQEGLHGWEREEMEAAAAAVRPFIPTVAVRGI